MKDQSMSTLDKLAIKHGTDKSSRHHNYTQYYEKHLLYRNKAINLLELGWGGHEDALKGGESARMWREYFPYANIVVIDNEYKDPSTFIPAVRFQKLSQDDSKGLTELSNENGGWDVVIDDASHISHLTCLPYSS